MKYLRASLRLLPLAVGGLVACDNSGTDLGFPSEKKNVVQVGVYLDRDGSQTFAPVVDTVYPGARVALLQRGSDDTLRVVLSDSRGISRFLDVPLGEYRVAVSQAGLGDSIEVGAIQISGVDSSLIKVRAADDTTNIEVRLTYPEVNIREARATPPGRRVFLRGVILAGVQSFRDTTSHLSDSSGAIRMTRVTVKGGLGGNAPGDSVSVLGITSTRLGQPTLDNATLTRLGTRPPPLPQIIGSGTAANASNGALDAALVQVTNALISDTITVTPDFKVVASDGTGSVTIVLDANINFVRSAFQPNKRVNVKGVLVPDGLGGWSIKPRDLTDVVVF